METEIILTIRNPVPSFRYYVCCEPVNDTSVFEKEPAPSTIANERLAASANERLAASANERLATIANEERILNRSRRNGAHCRCGKFLKQGSVACAKCSLKAWEAWSPAS